MPRRYQTYIRRSSAQRNFSEEPQRDLTKNLKKTDLRSESLETVRSYNKCGNFSELDENGCPAKSWKYEGSGRKNRPLKLKSSPERNSDIGEKGKFNYRRKKGVIYIAPLKTEIKTTSEETSSLKASTQETMKNYNSFPPHSSDSEPVDIQLRPSETVSYQINDINFTENPKPTIIFEVSSYRFVIISLYFSALALSSFVLFSFVSRLNQADSNEKSLKNHSINILIIYQIIAVSLDIPLQKLSLKIGLRNIMILSIALLSLATFLIYFLKDNWVIQTIVYLPICLALHITIILVGSLACIWFHPDHRLKIFSLNALWYRLGFLIPQLLLQMNITNNINENSKLIENSQSLLGVVYCSLITILLIAVIFLFRNTPKNPLNFSSLETRLTVGSSIKHLRSDMVFVKTCIGLAAFEGLCVSKLVFSLNSESLNKESLELPTPSSNFDLEYIMGFLGLLLLFIGSNCIIRSQFSVVNALIILITASQYFSIFFRFLDFQWASYGFDLCFGIARFILMPICIHFSIQHTFPVPESMVVGLLMSSSYAGSIINFLISTKIKEDLVGAPFFWISSLLILIIILTIIIAFKNLSLRNRRRLFEEGF